MKRFICYEPGSPDPASAASPEGVGESVACQVSTVARERMITIIANNKRVQTDCEQVLQILNDRPELDASFCRLFNITSGPAVRDVATR